MYGFGAQAYYVYVVYWTTFDSSQKCGREFWRVKFDHVLFYLVFISINHHLLSRNDFFYFLFLHFVLVSNIQKNMKGFCKMFGCVTAYIQVNYYNHYLYYKHRTLCLLPHEKCTNNRFINIHNAYLNCTTNTALKKLCALHQKFIQYCILFDWLFFCLQKKNRLIGNYHTNLYDSSQKHLYKILLLLLLLLTIASTTYRTGTLMLVLPIHTAYCRCMDGRDTLRHSTLVTQTIIDCVVNSPTAHRQAAALARTV